VQGSLIDHFASIKNSIFMSQFISLTQAVTVTTAYRNQKENILATAYQNQGILPICESFDKSQVQALLNKTNAAGIRVYYGMDESLKVHAVIVAYDSNNADIIPAGTTASTTATTTEEEGDIVDNGTRCPDICPPESSLNS
jgi:hypothetical protein